MPETIFQEIAAKVAISFFSEIKIFENKVFGHVTEVPTIKNQNWLCLKNIAKLNTLSGSLATWILIKERLL